MTHEDIACVNVTALFNSCVKTIRVKNRAIGVTLPPSKIFPTVSTTQVFNKAKDIQTVLTNHQNLLKEHRKKYLVDSSFDNLSDIEKNNMEKVISTNIKIMEDKIKSFDFEVKEATKEKKLNEQTLECYQTLVLILKTNLHKITSVFRELKDLRQNRQKVKDKLSRLQKPTISLKNIKPEKALQSLDEVDRAVLLEKNLIENPSKKENSIPKKCKPEKSSVNNDTSYFENILEDLSPEEQQLLEEENSHLYQELQSNQDEVRKITKQVVELGKIQDMLTENVDIQAHTIEEIQETIMAATENVQDGNEQVREAMRKDAGFRVWIMFFLIVMSFTILFLDWYNP